MRMSTFKILLIFCCAVMMMMMIMQPCMVEGLRIKRSNVPAPSANAESCLGQATMGVTQAGGGGAAAETARVMATVANTVSPPAVVTSSTRQGDAQDNDKSGVIEAPTVTTTTDTETVLDSAVTEEPLAALAQRNWSPFDNYNIWPDEKEMKEFEQVRSQYFKMMTESLLQKFDHDTEMEHQNMARVERFHAPENVPSEYYQQRQSVAALTPGLHMMQPAIEKHHSRNVSPLFQFLNGAVDTALQNEHVIIEHAGGDPSQVETDSQDNFYLMDELKTKPADGPNRKENELIFSCPVHYEQHENRNGEIVDEEVISVDQCHVQ
ncbi:Hypothetical predicted protein [Drosophila guanche]|uniref:Uncharacterized protein n=1 Tax=Drosophila guanche TaxID=7266 RepID=A0A3B0JR80_DROGU|nr:Hypothetical predicted protein [Drosophila guanche]